MSKKHYRSRLRCVCCGRPADAFTVDGDPYCIKCFDSALNVRWQSFLDNDFMPPSYDDMEEDI